MLVLRTHAEAIRVQLRSDTTHVPLAVVICRGLASVVTELSPVRYHQRLFDLNIGVQRHHVSEATVSQEDTKSVRVYQKFVFYRGELYGFYQRQKNPTNTPSVQHRSNVLSGQGTPLTGLPPNSPQMIPSRPNGRAIRERKLHDLFDPLGVHTQYLSWLAVRPND